MRYDLSRLEGTSCTPNFCAQNLITFYSDCPHLSVRLSKQPKNRRLHLLSLFSLLSHCLRIFAMGIFWSCGITAVVFAWDKIVSTTLILDTNCSADVKVAFWLYSKGTTFSSTSDCAASIHLTSAVMNAFCSLSVRGCGFISTYPGNNEMSR